MALTRSKTPDPPADAPADVPRHRDAISHNLLGTPSNPLDPISHNPVGPAKAYEGDADLDIGSILESEDDLKAQLRALPTERLHILYHAVQGESASR
jgi:hypothetical protein